MNALLHDHYRTIGSTIIPFPITADQTPRILVLVVTPEDRAPTTPGAIGYVDETDDEEPTWEDAEWC
jgi:hypothetical protein